MKHTILFASIALPLTYGKTSDQLCSGTAEKASDGNWYCAEVWAITYRNISQAGTYNRTTSVDRRTGTCGHERLDYPANGPLTPLFGEVKLIFGTLELVLMGIQVSMHLRGPMNVSQLAVYQLPSDSQALQKRNTVPFYNHRRAVNKRAVRFTLPNSFVDPHHIRPLDNQALNSTTRCNPRTLTSTTTVIDCGTIRSTSTPSSSQNTAYTNPPLPCLPTPSSSVINDSVQDCTYRNQPQAAAIAQEQPLGIIAPKPLKPAAASTKEEVVRRAATDWNRVAYYTSTAPAQATGLAFLANLGDPARSGTFD
jgi:hypothetical protein